MAILALRALRRADEPLDLRSLAAVLGCSRPNTTTLVDRLERDRLVIREADQADQRRKRVLVTARGATAADKGLRAMARCMRSFTDHFEEAERRELVRLLQKLERGASFHRLRAAWSDYDASWRSARRPPAIHVR